MKIQTLSVVVGTTACNAHCPFCVSKTTFTPDLPTEVNWRNFNKACKLAQIGGATTVLLTGKGEPSLYPDLIDDYLSNLGNQFPFIELQINGIEFAKDDFETNDNLKRWYRKGLNTICLSAVHYWQDMNRKIYSENYPPLDKTVKKLHDIGYTVRLSIMMMKGYVDNPEQINEVIGFCKIYKIKQLTFRPIAHPENNNNGISKWVKKHTISEDQLSVIQKFLDDNATPVLKLAHGAVVYDYFGQNVCLTNCLTTNETDEDMRQIIFYADGTISYDWKYKGAILL